MSALSEPAPAAPDDDLMERLRAAVEVELLSGRGFDFESLVFAPACDDPLFGWHDCERVGCEGAGHTARAAETGLCDLCHGTWRSRRRDSDLSLEQFKARPPTGTAAGTLCLVCRVDGASRPAVTNELCMRCDGARKKRGQSVKAYVAGDDRWPPAQPREALGGCGVLRCPRLASLRNGLCHACHCRWTRAGRPTMAAFCAAGPACRTTRSNGRTLSLAELPERVRLEVLIGLQASIRRSCRLSIATLAAALSALVEADVGSVGELKIYKRRCGPKGYRTANGRWAFLERTAHAAALAGTSIEQERHQDVWRLALWGARGELTLDFRPISQPWLRAVTKAFSWHTLPTRAPTTVAHTIRTGAGTLSTSLARRPDRGNNPAALGRSDIDDHLRWLRRNLDTDGNQVPHAVAALRRLLRFLDERSLDAADGPAQGLSPSFRLYREDQPAFTHTDPEEPGKALPLMVLAQLLDPVALDLLEQIGGQATRAAFEIAAHTGRRPSETLALTCTCLRFDETPIEGASADPVLIYTRVKPPRARLNLPIQHSTAELIQVAIARSQATFPATPAERLCLFPRSSRNRDGHEPLSTTEAARRIKLWIHELKPRGHDGQPFPADEIGLYPLRHTFAQRHADAGVELDVLQQLLDHSSPQTTQIYYRVTRERKRSAISRLAPLTIDRHGTRVGPAALELNTAEELRRSIGQIPVAMGYCTEPHNVQALGSACPYRWRCAGCDHFRTDPSHLPELREHLARLLRAREELLAAAPQLADWARKDATPSDGEIRAVRDLIRSNQDLLDTLEDDERHTLEELISVLRKTRASLDNTLAVDHVAAIKPPRPQLIGFEAPNG